MATLIELQNQIIQQLQRIKGQVTPTITTQPLATAQPAPTISEDSLEFCTRNQGSVAPFADITYSNPNALLQNYYQSYTDAQNVIDLNNNPLSFNKVAFDTYKHIQDNRLSQLENQINELNIISMNNNNPKPIKAIKNMNNSKVMNVEKFNKNNQDYYLLYGNNGCLEYNAPSSSSSASWAFNKCNANNAKQQFNINKISNMTDFNNKITNPINNTYKLNSDENTLFGFYTVNPVNNQDQCLQLNNDGLTVMPCNLLSSQRYRPMYNSVL